MKTGIIRDQFINHTIDIFDCRTARRISWAIMAAAAGYFLFHLLLSF